MKVSLTYALLLTLACSLHASDRSQHEWLTGKVIDENRARYLAGVYHNGQSTSTTSGTVAGQSTTTGNNTEINGTYSGSTTTSSSGVTTPLYRVYENLIVEGEDMIYVTQERIRWRWSKGAQVTVNGEVKYYVDKRKLHVLDDVGKEHVIEIVKQIKKEKPVPTADKR